MCDEAAKKKALDYLSRRSYTLEELRRKLAARGFDSDRIEPVLHRLAELRLVDDRAVAYNHARRRAEEGRRGRARVRSELLQRGLATRLVDEVLGEVFTEEREQQAFERALERLAPRGLPEQREDRAKLARRLLRAGFAGRLVGRITGGDSAGAGISDDEDG